MVGAFALALVLTAMTFVVLRRTVINPLQRAATRIENIAKGDLTMPDDPTSRSEIGRLTRDLQTMQHSLVTTVGTVRQGLKRFIAAPARSLRGIPTSLLVPNSRQPRLSRPPPAWSS